MAQRWGIRAGFATYGLFAVAMTGVAVWLAMAAAREKNVESPSFDEVANEGLENEST
jgi:hypothetical protein